MRIDLNRLVQRDDHGQVSRNVGTRRMAGPLVLLSAFVLVAPASAAPITYGNFVGTHVIYGAVTEDSADPLPLFGAPTITGDLLDFAALSFDAASIGGGSASTIGTLSFTITAKPGSRIEKIVLTDAGDTTLIGNVPLDTLDTWSRAGTNFSNGAITISEVDFVAISPIVIPFNVTHSPSGGSFFLGTDGGGGPIYQTAFTGSATLEVAQFLMILSVPFTFGATSATVDWETPIQANSEAGTAAFISTNGVSVMTSVTRVRREVPEPVTLSLLAIGLCGVAARRFGA